MGVGAGIAGWADGELVARSKTERSSQQRPEFAITGPQRRERQSAVHLLFRSGRTVTLGPLRALAPDFSSLDPAAAGLTILALMLTFAARLPMLGLVAALVAAGVALKAVGLA